MRGMKMRIISCFGDRTISRYCLGLLDRKLHECFQQYSLTVAFLDYFFIMPMGFNLNVTYGFKPQVSSIKMVTVYRRSIFQLWVTIPQGQHHVSSAQKR